MTKDPVVQFLNTVWREYSDDKRPTPVLAQSADWTRVRDHYIIDLRAIDRVDILPIPIAGMEPAGWAVPNIVKSGYVNILCNYDMALPAVQAYIQNLLIRGPGYYVMDSETCTKLPMVISNKMVVCGATDVH